MTIIAGLFAFFGCKTDEEKFIEKNKIIYFGTNEFTKFEANAVIKIDSVWKIQKKYAEEKNKSPENWLFFIIDDNYVFNSSITPKESKTFIRGIWINSKTGEAKYNNSEIRLRYKKAYNGDGKKFTYGYIR